MKKKFFVLPARRGFASTLIAVLAIVFVSGLAAVLLASSAQQRALLASFESRKTANHFDNAVFFLNASFRDAVFDFEYSRTGCVGRVPLPQNFNELTAEYSALALRELNSSVETNFSGFELGYASVAPLSNEYSYAVAANASLALFVRAGSAFKNESVFLEQRIDVNDSVPNIAWKANLSGVLVVVDCFTPPP